MAAYGVTLICQMASRVAFDLRTCDAGSDATRGHIRARIASARFALTCGPCPVDEGRASEVPRRKPHKY
jgi:hypothetical protein